MIDVIRYQDLGRANYGWLDARYHFSFAQYYDPERMGFGVLRVVNDDTISAGAGFPQHPHRNMEIITYVREGAITHQDNQGNRGRTEAGDVQVMSAGRGIYHSEMNVEPIATRLFQIWIEPNKHSVEPGWSSHKFPKKPVSDKLHLLVSGDGRAPLQVHQDVFIYAGRLSKGAQLNHLVSSCAYILISDGDMQVQGYEVSRGDALQLADESQITLYAATDAEILVIDMPSAELPH